MTPSRLARFLPGIAALVLAANRADAAPCTATAGVLTVDGITCQLAGVHSYTSVTVKNNGTIEVPAFDGTDKVNTGNLELRSPSITIDAGSRILARGSGYQTRICGDGAGPTIDAGGRGGCSVRDSGGGGAHFGRGGRGTKDITGTQAFPRDFEENCGNSVTYSMTGVPSCSSVTDCRNSDGLPTVAGLPYVHSIYLPEFGGSGGDKGCRDGDGTTLATAGSGGGRVVLAALGGSGVVTVNGTIDATGKRGCGIENDSAGGGAGGTVVVVGDRVNIGATAVVTSAGGLGGDTQGGLPGSDCPAPAQQTGTCDDCGGGGGGGVISVLSVASTISDEAVFNVSGALGGVCPICRGEAGGGVGELQISGGYVGELCDNFDNDFDSQTDEGLPDLACPNMSMPSCINGVPQTCPANVPACEAPVTDTRARFAVIVDTSGSMLGDLAGVPTFGDGAVGHLGRDHDNNGQADDSRLFKAKLALSRVVAAYPDIDFALARYHQDESLNRSCQLAHTFECQSICCSYDNPANNTAPAPTPACTVDGGNGTTLTVLKNSPGDECINYAGTCGPPRRGADVVVGFDKDINNYLMWMNGTETNFRSANDQPGAYCDFAQGGDCELRGTGPTPLANSLQAMEDYLGPIKACDRAASGGCRKYNVILLTDGAESCQGDPVMAAAALRAKGINTYVIGFSTLASETAQLNSIAASGGTGAAFLVGNDDALANALAQIVSGSIVFETCNNLDDDCDTRIDEDFPNKGAACDNGLLGTCRGTGSLGCSANGSGLQCNITMPGTAPGVEICNGMDDNCNGAIDEGLDCTPGCVITSPTDLCNGIDDDCDGQFEEDDPNVGQPCGTTDQPPCKLGVKACIGGQIQCVGAVDPQTEQCNGVDDNCDGLPDDNAPCPTQTTCIEGGCRFQCIPGEFPCPAGYKCDTTPTGDFCVPSACANCQPSEICKNDMCVDPCAGVTCDASEECRFGTCVDCNVFGCPTDQLCVASQCVVDQCLGVDCATGCTDPDGCSCTNGTCAGNCNDSDCPTGQRCGAGNQCVADSCAGVACVDPSVCVDGACMVDPCTAVTCPTGNVCVGGACVDDPCKTVVCSEGYTCQVRDGDGLCLPAVPDHVADYVQPGGGGGCNTTGGGSSSLVLVALGLLVTRRRKVAS